MNYVWPWPVTSASSCPLLPEVDSTLGHIGITLDNYWRSKLLVNMIQLTRCCSISNVCFSESFSFSRNMRSREFLTIEPLTSILRISRVFGVAPVSIDPIHEINIRKRSFKTHRISVSQYWNITSCIFVLIILVGNITRIIYNRSYGVRGKEQTVRTLFSQCVYFVTFISYTTIMSFAVLRGRNKMKHYIEYLSTLEMINLQMNSSYTNIKFTKFKIIFWSSFLAIVTISLLYFRNFFALVIADLKNNVLTAIAYFVYYFVNIAIVMMLFQFAFLVCLLNATINNFNKHMSNIFQNNGNITNVRLKIKRFSQMHETICNLIIKINKQESTLILFIFLYKMIDIMDALFIFKTWDATQYELGPTLLEGSWIIYRGAALVLLIEPCHQTQEALEKVKISISHLLSMSRKGYVKEELYSFSRQVARTVRNFSPHYIITFSRQLLLRIAGVFISYMVVIIQFHLKDHEF